MLAVEEEKELGSVRFGRQLTGPVPDCLGSPSYPGTIMQTGNYHFTASGSSSIAAAAAAAVVHGGGHRKLTRAENSRVWRN